MTNMLSEIVWNKRHEVAVRKSTLSQEQLAKTATNANGSFIKALRGPDTSLITEIKPRSPSAGTLAGSMDLEALSRIYAGYASAISVLTDNKYFGGSLNLLKRVASNTGVPVLCKDFFIDPYQVYEARHSGAEAILLIVKILSDSQLNVLQALARSLNMAAVIEIQNEEELHRALAIDPDIVMINNRNLTTFKIDLATTSRLAPLIPESTIIISASGIEHRHEIDQLSRYTNNFLIGSSLMRSQDVESKLKELTALSPKISTEK